MYDEDKNEYECYIKGTMELLMCREYSASELKILLRLSAFKTVFFEGATKTAQLLNLSVKTVQAAKRRFEDLGILEEIEDHGHGKRYKVNKDLIDHPSYLFATPQDAPERTQGEKTQKHPTERVKMQESAEKSESQQENAQAEPRDPKAYGDKDVNDLLEAWRDATGFDFMDNKQQRKCAKIALNMYGKNKAHDIAQRVGAVQEDRFAPRITSPNDIVGKYSKLPDLELYEKKHRAAQDAPNPQPTTKTPNKKAMRKYVDPDFRWADYDTENREEDPEVRAEAIKRARAIFESRRNK